MAVPASARAQWQPNGIPVCTNGSIQSNPLATSDGTGGSYIAWVDYRGGRTMGDGTVAPGWPVDGPLQCPGDAGRTSDCRRWPGGVFIAWGDTRAFPASSTDVCASRITADGALFPGWTTDGNAICTAPGVQGPYVITCRG